MSDMSVLPVNDNNGFGGGLGAGQAQVAPMSDLIQMPKVDVEDVNPHF
jgi:hypothetical protein